MSGVRRFSASGFRGFALEQSLSFSLGGAPAGVVLFGDNGTGKSSFADAIEFLFSEKGIIDRLGARPSENQAGMQALLHRETLRNGLPGKVHVELTDGQTLSRTVSTAASCDPLPKAVADIRSVAPVPPLLRSTEMRTFVADKKGKDRYVQLARWIGLERLTGIQDALTRIDNKLSAENRVEAKNEHQRALTKLTGDVVPAWNETAVLDWANAQPLKQFEGLRLTALTEIEAAELSIAQKEREEGRREGLEDFRLAREAATGLLPDTGGILDRLKAGKAELQVASDNQRELESHVEIAQLREVWSAVSSYLRAIPSQNCPACLRPFEPPTTREAVLADIDNHLASLTNVEVARKRTLKALSVLEREVQALRGQLQSVIRTARPLADRPFVELRASAEVVLEKLPPEDNIRKDLESLALDLGRLPLLASAAVKSADERKAEIEKRFEIPYQQKLSELRRLREIRDEWTRLSREEQELSRVLEQFRSVEKAVRDRVHAHITRILGDLQDDVRKIYAALRRNDEHLPVVHVVVEAKSMSVVLDLFGETLMVPNSYLSDSQLNSLGLALYLAAVRRFNRSFPFIVLDDVISSYDASHRLNLIEVIRVFLGDFQLLITTHDEPFYRQARSILNFGGRWRFLRLQQWTLSRGIRLRHEGTTAEELALLIDGGARADILAQVIMSDFEDWLASLCASANVNVSVRIKRDGSTGEPTVSELWAAAQRCFDDLERAHASYPFLAAHGLLNWSRHAASAATMTLTSAEFQTFFDHYAEFRKAYESRRAT